MDSPPNAKKREAKFKDKLVEKIARFCFSDVNELDQSRV